LSGEGTSGVIEITDKYEEGEPTRYFQLVVYIEAAKLKFWRSKVVVFAPRYVIVNNTPNVVLFSQSPVDIQGDAYRLAPDQQLPFHWPNMYGSDKCAHLCIEEEKSGWNWSGSFPVNKFGSFTFKLRHAESSRVFLAKIDIRMDKKTTFISISPENTEFPVYRIENNTKNVLLLLRQKGFLIVDYVQPGESVPYAWDEPSQSSQTLQVQFDKGTGRIKEFQLDELKTYPSFEISDRVTQEAILITCEVLAEGPTKVLQITEIQEEEVREIIKQKEEEEIDYTNYVVSLDGIGVSFVNEIPEELLFLTVQKIELEYGTSNLNTKMEFRIGFLQLDNQILSTNHPILLIPMSTLAGTHSNFFHLSMVKNNRSKSIDFIHYFSILLQEMDIALDEVLLLKIIQFVSVIMDFYEENADSETMVEEQSVVKANPVQETRMLYFQLLHLNPIKVNVTFTHVPGIDPENYNSKWTSTLRRAGALASIDSAPLELHGFRWQHPFSTREDLINRVTMHYTDGIIREVYKILGSADFLGNPISLLGSVRGAIRDFYHEPHKGWVISPKDYGLGIVKGTQSLVRGSVYGVFNTTAKITGSIGKGMANLSTDLDYLQERDVLHREHPRHVGEGFAHGVRDLGLGLFRGFTGVIVEPAKGFQRDGVAGLGKGLLGGLIGILAKPAVGCIDLISQTAEGIKNTATYFDDTQIRRRRPPRYFGPDKVLRRYQFRKAQGQELLYTLEGGKYFHEWYQYHFPVGRKSILLSNQHFFCTQENHEEWVVNLREIKGLQFIKPDVIVVLLEKYSSSSVFETPTNKRIIMMAGTPTAPYAEKIFNCLVQTLRHLKHPIVRELLELEDS